MGLFLTFTLLSGFNPRKIMEQIDKILYRNKDKRIVSIVNGVFDDNGNIWLSWNEFDKKSNDWRETALAPVKKYYSYWYVQKFDSSGAACFPQIEMIKGELPFGGAAIPIHLGNLNDIYGFSHYIERVDNLGNHYTSNKNYKYNVGNMFIDTNGIMYVFGTFYGGSKGGGARRAGPSGCVKFRIREPLPVYIETQRLPSWYEPDAYKYVWIYSTLIYVEPSGCTGLFFLPPLLKNISYVDTTRINVYRVSLPDLMSVDTSSFRIEEALFKKISGCKLRTHQLTSRGQEIRWLNVSALVEGNGDTLVLYLSSRGGDEDLIYVCRLTKEGKPIKAKEIIEDEVKDFDKAPVELHRKIIFRGRVTGQLDQPTGIMIYGFDKSGNVYYYLWDKSDDYWRQ